VKQSSFYPDDHMRRVLRGASIRIDHGRQPASSAIGPDPGAQEMLDVYAERASHPMSS
jgi:hypothetical protein